MAAETLVNCMLLTSGNGQQIEFFPKRMLSILTRFYINSGMTYVSPQILRTNPSLNHYPIMRGGAFLDLTTN
jgi:hypothetical protein